MKHYNKLLLGVLVFTKSIFSMIKYSNNLNVIFCNNKDVVSGVNEIIKNPKLSKKFALEVGLGTLIDPDTEKTLDLKAMINGLDKFFDQLGKGHNPIDVNVYGNNNNTNIEFEIINQKTQQSSGIKPWDKYPMLVKYIQNLE
jgi:hypothetical protein